jgi:two-component system response regulator TctD
MPGAILIVEDDDAVRTVFSRALRKEGHEVDEAADGDIALDAIRRGDYRVVVLDLRLPKKSGFEVLAALRDDRRALGARQPVILVLSSASEDVRQVAGDARVMLSINKTFALQHLEPVIAAISAVVSAGT